MNARVLVVDDEEAIRSTMKQAIDYAGHDCLLARSGQEGLDVVERESLDVVFLDIKMPGMDGLALLERLRERPATATVPVVFMTARGRQADLDRYHAAGAAGVIVKPFDPLTLADRIRGLMAASES